MAKGDRVAYSYAASAPVSPATAVGTSHQSTTRVLLVQGQHRTHDAQPDSVSTCRTRDVVWQQCGAARCRWSALHAADRQCHE